MRELSGPAAGSAAISLSWAACSRSARPSSAAALFSPAIESVSTSSGGHAGEPRPVAVEQREAAAGAALGIDGHARGAEIVGVAVDGAHRDLELIGQRLRRDAAPRLEEQEHREKPARPHFSRPARG